jgi:PEP-CTERM/exosortase A-associated glycosyltransferase
MTYRILHVLDHSIPLHSGYTFRTLAILEEQRRRGWQTFHLTSSKHYGAKTDEEEVDGYHFFRTLSPADSRWRRLSVLDQWAVIADTTRRLEAVARTVRPDILHAHSPCLNGIAALRVGRRLGLPVVYEIRAFWEDAAVDHGTTTEGSLRYRFSRALETWTIKRAHAITTICEGLRQDILMRGIPESRVTVIPNAVNPAQFPVIEQGDPSLRAQLGLAPDAFTVGFIGSFYGYEGLDTLLDAAPLMARDIPGLRVLLVGGGPEDARLREQAACLGIADRVIFTGRVPHDQVGRYYGEIDVLAYPRHKMRLTETVTPLKPLEAMAQGRLLVASDVGGHRELIRDGENGFLFESGSAAALGAAVAKVATLPDKGAAIRRNARQFVETDRNWPASVSRYEGVYDRVTAQRPRH